MTRRTRRGSDADEMARILKRHDRRLSDIERRKEKDDQIIDFSEEENGVIVEANVFYETYNSEDDMQEDEPIATGESHNMATDFCDEFLAHSMKHVGGRPARPSEIAFGNGDEINGSLSKVGETPIDESYVSGQDCVLIGHLDSTQLNGHDLTEVGVSGDDGLFNHAPLDPMIEKSSDQQVKFKIRFLFLHD